MQIRLAILAIALAALAMPNAAARAASAQLSLNDGTFLPGGVFGGAAATDPLSISHTLFGSVGDFRSEVFGSADIPSGQVDAFATAEGSTTGGAGGEATITDLITITGGTPGVAVPVTLELVVAGEFQMAGAESVGGASRGDLSATLGGTGALFVERYRQFNGTGSIVTDTITPSGPAAAFFEDVDLDHFTATLSKTSMLMPGSTLPITARVGASTTYVFPVTARTTTPAQLVILLPPDVGFTSQSGALLTAPEPAPVALGATALAALAWRRRARSGQRKAALVRGRASR